MLEIQAWLSVFSFESAFDRWLACLRYIVIRAFANACSPVAVLIAQTML